MVSALKKGGIVAFSIKEKLLNPKTDKGTGYSNAIQKLIDDGIWEPIHEVEFANQGSFPNFERPKSNKDRSRVMIF